MSAECIRRSTAICEGKFERTHDNQISCGFTVFSITKYKSDSISLMCTASPMIEHEQCGPCSISHRNQITRSPALHVSLSKSQVKSRNCLVYTVSRNVHTIIFHGKLSWVFELSYVHSIPEVRFFWCPISSIFSFIIESLMLVLEPSGDSEAALCFVALVIVNKSFVQCLSSPYLIVLVIYFACILEYAFQGAEFIEECGLRKRF